MATLMRRAEFARHLNVDRSHVTRLGHAGHLIERDGLVDLEATLAHLEAMRGQRPDVAQRFARRRAAAASPASPAPTPAAPPPEPLDAHDQTARTLRIAKAREQIALAELREMERDEKARLQFPWPDVEQLATHSGASLRALIDNFPDQVAPLVAPLTDIDATADVLREQCRWLLDEFVRSLRRAAEQLRGAQS